jgi:hypothetical protein
MKHIENLVKQLLNVDYTYEHVGAIGLQERLVGAKPTGYVYYKAEDLLPIISAMEKEINEH